MFSLCISQTHVLLATPSTLKRAENVPFCEEIDRIANEALKMFNVPGAALALVINDQVILTRGYGTRKANEELPVTEQTLFPIASCTKSFTALLLAQLVDEGKVAFDAPVRKYIPEFCLMDEERTQKLTIRDLLAHRTGYARHDPIWFFSDLPRAAVPGLFKYLEPACGLRQEFQYNNLMYTIAGLVVERITGQSWEEATTRRLLIPLDMKNSTVTWEQLETCLNYALPHAEMDGHIKIIPFHDTTVENPGGGISSNAVDMSQWLKFQFSDGQILNLRPQTFKELHTQQMPISLSPKEINENYTCTGYGLGWFIGKYRDYELINHGGDIDGFSSDVTLLPEKKIGIAILTNSSSDGRSFIFYVRNQIIDQMLGLEDNNWIKKLLTAHDQTKKSISNELKGFNELSERNQKVCLQDYVGYFDHPAYGPVKIKIKDNHLFAEYGRVQVDLYSKSDLIFSSLFPELLFYGIPPVIDFSFFKNSSGEIDRLQIPFEGFRAAKPITFSKVPCP